MSTSPLVFVELVDGEPSPGSLGLLAVASQLAPSVAAVVCGSGAARAAGLLREYGSETTWHCEDPALDPAFGQPFVAAVAWLVLEHSLTTILFENSTLAAHVAGGLAARLDAGVNWDLESVSLSEDGLRGVAFGLDDTVAVECTWRSPLQLAVFRRGACMPVAKPVTGRICAFEPDLGQCARGLRVTERRDDPDLGGGLQSAEVIVAGGRGLRDRTALRLLEDLADALGGTVAVSLPLVDRGWYPAGRQVGQTGKTVKPRLYVACGISGALAHRVGMDASETIVAINTDAAAPILNVAHAAAIGDLHEIVPALTEEIRAHRSR